MKQRSRGRGRPSPFGMRVGTRALGFALASLLSASMMVCPAFAQPAAERAPSASQAVSPPTRVFALIVTNNRSATLDRPDLKYADDDGANYHALFRALGRAEDVVLLTRFDDDTARGHPALPAVTGPPRLAQVRGALATLRERIGAARRAGERSAFYFVFAGHGDVDGGKGFLELEDGRLDADFLEREIVDGLGADVQHLILDSCNSFFVINPRKPGGRRWATPQDLTTGFSQRHPQVGLLLSTNAEAEVYEWSELGAGVFSYEVRAGLSGAADTDGDGVVRYDELAGYLENANREVLSDDLRPRILARGPFGRGDAALFPTGALGGRSLLVGPGQRHLWLRGARGQRVLDLHKENAGTLKLVLPEGAGPFSLFEQTTPPGAARPVVSEVVLPSDRASIVLAELAPVASSTGTRGGEALFGRLFAQPWGPDAYARYLKERASAPDEVYGVTRQDEGPVRRYLQRLRELGAQGVAATGELAEAMLPARLWEPLRARSGGPAPTLVVAKPPPLPRPGPWDDGRVASGDNAFTLARHDVRLSLFGRSAVALGARTELSTILALDLSLFPNLSLKHRFAESTHLAAAWKLAAGGGFYEVSLAGASPFPVLVGHGGYLLGAYQHVELQVSLQPVRPLTFTVRAGGVLAEVYGGDAGFADAHGALAFGSGPGGHAFGGSAGFETDLVLGPHDALVLDASGFLYDGSDYLLLTTVLGWTHAWAHLHTSVGALAVVDVSRAQEVDTRRRALPFVNLDGTF